MTLVQNATPLAVIEVPQIADKVKAARSAVIALRADIDRVEIYPDSSQYVTIRLELKAIRERLDEVMQMLEAE